MRLLHIFLLFLLGTCATPPLFLFIFFLILNEESTHFHRFVDLDSLTRIVHIFIFLAWWGWYVGNLSLVYDECFCIFSCLYLCFLACHTSCFVVTWRNCYSIDWLSFHVHGQQRRMKQKIRKNLRKENAKNHKKTNK